MAKNVVIGTRYRLLRLIGAGNMGEVWEAEHVTLGSRLAVKLIRDAALAGSDILKRFELEACAGADLGTLTDHAALTFDYGVDEVHGPYLAMQLLEGQSLDRYLSARGPLSPRKTVAILKQVARAVRKAHARGMVIRDIKPANVFMSRHPGEDEHVKLIDFGVIKFLRPGGGPTETVIAGTPSYMSPELISGQPIDARCDLWALNVMLYYMLTGRMPFVGNHYDAIRRAILAAEVEPPSRVISQLGPSFDAYFLRAFAPDVSRRYQDIDAVESAFVSAWRPVPSPRGEPAPGRPPLDSSTAPSPHAQPPCASPAAPIAPSTPGAAPKEDARVLIESSPTMLSPVTTRSRGPGGRVRKARRRRSRRRT